MTESPSPRLHRAAGCSAALRRLASLPLYLAVRGAPQEVEVMVFAWLIAPILVSYYLSRTGHYERAHILSSTALAAVVMAVCINTGGISSFAAIWLWPFRSMRAVRVAACRYHRRRAGARLARWVLS